MYYLYSETCVREPLLRLTLNRGWCEKRCLTYKGTCHVILLAKLHDMYLYKTPTFPHQPLMSISKVALLHPSELFGVYLPVRVHLIHQWCLVSEQCDKGKQCRAKSDAASSLIVRLSLLTLTNPNEMREVLLFVCSKMADETNLSSKLPVADRTRAVWGRELCWWCLSSGFPLCTFPLGFAESFRFVLISTPLFEALPLCSILCNLFPDSVGMLKSLREAIRVSLFRVFWPP